MIQWNRIRCDLTDLQNESPQLSSPSIARVTKLIFRHERFKLWIVSMRYALSKYLGEMNYNSNAPKL